MANKSRIFFVIVVLLEELWDIPMVGTAFGLAGDCYCYIIMLAVLDGLWIYDRCRENE